MIKPALQHLKESFPDLDEKEMDKMVEVMKRYAREAGENVRLKCSVNAKAGVSPQHGFGTWAYIIPDSILNTEIILP